MNTTRPADPVLEPAIGSLPLVTLYLTDRCNSRCVTCDYWRHGHTDLTLDSVAGLLPSLTRLGTQVVLLSGGEPLLNPQWPQIARLLRKHGLKVWLLTSGLALAKHAATAAAECDSITVSLDGTTGPTYQAIRGLDAFETVCAGIRAAAAAGACVSVRVTVQRANYRELPDFVELTRALGARQVSFLAVDVSNRHAFGRTGDVGVGLALTPADLPVLARTFDALERDHAEDFARQFIAETPQKLRRILQYFTALIGGAAFPAVRCNAPEFSAVVNADGRLQPCFFIPPPAPTAAGSDVDSMLNVPAMGSLRASIRAGRRQECTRCVCSMWRGADARSCADLLPLPRLATTA